MSKFKFRIHALVLSFVMMCFTSFQKISAQSNDGDHYAKLLLLAEEYPDSALLGFRELYLNVRKDNNVYMMAKVSEAMGDIYSNLDSYANAKDAYQDALVQFQDIDSVQSTARLLIEVGLMKYWLGDYDGASIAYLEGAKIAREFDDYVSESKAYHDLGMVYSNIENRALALKYYNKALGINARHNGLEIQSAGVLQNIGVEFSRLGDIDSAIFYYRKSLAIFKKHQETSSIAISYNNLGVLFEKGGDLDSTLHYYKRAYNIFDQLGFKRGVTVAFFNISQVYQHKNDYIKSLEYLNKSLEVAREIELKEQVQSVYLSTSDVYGSMGDYKNAYNNLIKAYDWRDTIYTIEQANQIAVFEAEYESKRKENEILLLQAQREKERTYIIFLSAVLIVLLMIIVFIVIYYRLRNKAILEKAVASEQTKRFKSVIEAQESERKRIAGELHDSVGPLLSLTQLYISDLSESNGQEDVEVQEMFSKTLTIIEEACDETRNISHNLMPGVLIRSGLVSAMRELVNKIKAANHYKITFNSNGIKSRFNESIEITIYRVFQELLNNIFKHSEATEINVDMNIDGRALVLTVVDNGRGFEIDKLRNASGIGWKNIILRLSLINATVNVKSGTNGTNVDVHCPITL